MIRSFFYVYNRYWRAFYFILLWLFVFQGVISAASGSAGVQISGKLPSFIANINKPYIVVGPLDIPRGHHTTIEKGTIFLFRNFTYITIYGTISVEGTKDNPVIFTSENDTAYNPSATLEPAPYDWDGIAVRSSDSTCVFKYAKVRYSLYGIKSVTRSIAIVGCDFLQNGQSDVVFEGSKPEKISSPYTYIPEKLKPYFDSLKGVFIQKPLKDTVKQKTMEPLVAVSQTEQQKEREQREVKEKELKDKEQREKELREKELKVQREKELMEQESKVQREKEFKEKKKKTKVVVTVPPKKSKPELPPQIQEDKSGSGSKVALRFIALSMAGIGIGGGGYETIKFLDAKKGFVTKVPKQTLLTQQEAKKTYKGVEKHYQYMLMGYGVGLLGMVIFTFSFTF